MPAHVHQYPLSFSLSPSPPPSSTSSRSIPTTHGAHPAGDQSPDAGPVASCHVQKIFLVSMLPCPVKAVRCGAEPAQFSPELRCGLFPMSERVSRPCPCAHPHLQKYVHGGRISDACKTVFIWWSAHTDPTNTDNFFARHVERRSRVCWAPRPS